MTPQQATHATATSALAEPDDAPPATTPSHIGLIAGEGGFPFLIADTARDRGVRVTALAIREITSPELAEHVDEIRWLEFGQFNRLIEVCHAADITKVVLAGRIHHRSIFQLTKIDRRGLKLLSRIASRRANAVLGAFTQELADEGIEALDSTMFVCECLPAAGLLTPGCPPGPEVMKDIEFGRPLAETVAGHDIGQTIIVKQGTVVAVEAMEGTNLTILRAGEIAGEGCVVLKIAKPNQDRRFDVPVMGLTTIRKLIQARCRALAFPGGQALLFDREEACALAQSHGITIHAWDV